jgi:hypothetical protein
VALKRERMRRRLLAGREAWRRMEQEAVPLGPWAHLALCFGAVVVACGLLALFSAHQPALKLFHRWFPGVAALFALLLFAFLSVLMRGWVGRTLIAIPLGALASYAAAPLAFHFYFALFETAQWRKWLAGTDHWMAAVLTIAVWPSFLLAWLFGAVAAALYLAGALGLEMRGLALFKAWRARQVKAP